MRTEASIDIAAPPEKVWSVMSDVERWPEWTASVTSVDRLDADHFAVGSRARIRQPKIPATVWKVTKLEPGSYFEWHAQSPGANVNAGHGVEAAPGGSRAWLWIDQAGLLGTLSGLIYKKLTRQYLDMEAAGLKRRSESS